MLRGEYAEIVEGLFAGEGCIEPPSVDAVVCLEPSCRVKMGGAEEYCYPIMDGSVEPLEKFVEALLKLMELLDRGMRVYVHCMAGCGRTGTLVAGYLILRRGLSAEEAVGLFRWRRGCGPETWEQFEFLYALEHLVRRIGVDAAINLLGSSRDLGEFLGKAREAAG